MIELSKENYAHVLPLLKNLAYEPVFAYSVIERNQSGKVFVDHNENPTCSLIINSYGQYFLVKRGDNECFMSDVVEFCEMIKIIQNITIFMLQHPNYCFKLAKV